MVIEEHETDNLKQVIVKDWKPKVLEDILKILI